MASGLAVEGMGSGRIAGGALTGSEEEGVVLPTSRATVSVVGDCVGVVLGEEERSVVAVVVCESAALVGEAVSAGGVERALPVAVAAVAVVAVAAEREVPKLLRT